MYLDHVFSWADLRGRLQVFFSLCVLRIGDQLSHLLYLPFEIRDGGGGGGLDGAMVG